MSDVVKSMDQNTLEACQEQTMAAINEFDKLSYEEMEYFMEAEEGLYNAIMVYLSDVLAGMMGEIVPMSLLPLEEYKVYLELTEFSKEDLEQFSVVRMLNLLQYENGEYFKFEGNETSVWRYEKDETSGIEDYKEYSIASDDKINLYPEDGQDSFQFEIIVGTGGQLNPDNRRYIVKACLIDNFDFDFDLELYIEKNEGMREKVIPTNCNFWVSTGTFNGGTETFEELNYDFSFDGSVSEELGDQGKVLLNIKSELAKNPRVKIEIYPVIVYEWSGKWSYATLKTPITDKILNQNMNNMGTGYTVSGERNTDATFRVVMYVDGEEYSDKYLCMRYWNWYPAHVGTLFNIQDNSRENVFSNLQTDFDSRNKVSTLIFELKKGYHANDEYYLDYDFVMQKNYADGLQTNYDAWVKKIVLGHYESLEEAEAAGAIDVTDSVLRNGYLGNYGGEGINFTVFKYYSLSQSFPLLYDTTADKITVKVVENNDEPWREFTEAPIIGETDPWFKITGVNDNNNNPLETYVVENGKNINMDTMYGYGYQTILIKDTSIDLKKLRPIYWTADSGHVTDVRVIDAAGQQKKVNSGDEINCDGKVQFIVTIDGRQKNYMVDFVKKAKGPKLYVSGPSTQEVFLDEYFEYKHDILIANIGDETLTGLKVELNATNCKLDDYWTVSGNDTLAPFTMVSSNTEYGEIDNIAKIRLLPDGEGDIEGTLTITADGQEPIVITLTGRAQNPKITTDKLENAVKYVPYSYIIATNNMYDWNSVEFSITSGSIPDGMTFDSGTGEIYGAPLKEGNYKFTVQAKYGREDYFEPSSKEFTITVLDNENETVFNTSDMGYAIIPDENGDVGYIGEQVSDYDFVLTTLDEDEIYISEGEYGEFVKLWLNGEVLTEGVDYTKEPGSTRITIKSQTLKNKTTDGSNTISAEYNVNNKRGENLKRTSQNFRIDLANKQDPVNPSNPTNPSNPMNPSNPANPNNPINPNIPSIPMNPGTVTNPGDSANSTNSGNSISSNNQNGSNILNIGSLNSISNGEQTNTINMVVHLINSSEKALVNYIVEIHSKVQSSRSDSSGNVSFNGIEFGNHTIYVKNEAGTTLASKNLELVKGDSFSIDGDKITVKPGQTISFSLVVKDSNLTIQDVQNLEAVSSPKTGDYTNVNLWIITLFISLAGISLELVTLYKKRVLK